MEKDIQTALRQETTLGGDPIRELFEEFKNLAAKAQEPDITTPKILLDPKALDSLEKIVGMLQTTIERDLQTLEQLGELHEMDKEIVAGAQEEIAVLQSNEHPNQEAVERAAKVLELDRQTMAQTEQLQGAYNQQLAENSEMIDLFQEIVEENKQAQTSEQKASDGKEQNSGLDGLKSPLNHGLGHKTPINTQDHTNRPKKKGRSM